MAEFNFILAKLCELTYYGIDVIDVIDVLAPVIFDVLSVV
jgi:hypothetical protein